MAFVLTESDIFKYVVLGEDGDRDRVKSSARKLLTRIPLNIFENEYYIIYKAIEQTNRFNIPLSYDNLHQMLVSNIGDLIENKNITMLSDGDYTDAERSDRIIDACLMEFDLLSESEIVNEDDMLANIEYYIDTWGKKKIREITMNQLDILDEGKMVGRRLYKGVQDSKVYYDKAYDVVRTLMDADAGALSENINTAVDTTEEIREKVDEGDGTESVSKMGISDIDMYYDFSRGEIVTIQAGTGVGKTRISANMCYNSLKMGKNVLYISLEQKSGRIFPMFQARHILEKFGDYPDLDDKSIIRKTYNYEREPLIDEATTDLRENPNIGRLLIEGRSIDADDLRNFLIKVWEDGFHFDVVVLDYIGLLETKGGGRYEKLTEAINMLKSECKSFKGRGFLGIIPNQLTPEMEREMEANNYEIGSKTGGSETQYVSRASDYIFTIWQSDIMRQMSEMGITVDKVRLGEIFKKKVKTVVDLGKVMFMDADEEEEVS